PAPAGPRHVDVEGRTRGNGSSGYRVPAEGAGVDPHRAARPARGRGLRSGSPIVEWEGRQATRGPPTAPRCPGPRPHRALGASAWVCALGARRWTRLRGTSLV